MTSDMMASSKKLFDPDFGISQGQAAEILSKSCGFHLNKTLSIGNHMNRQRDILTILFYTIFLKGTLKLNVMTFVNDGT